MIKLLTDLGSYKKGDIIDLGGRKNRKLVDKNQAIWVKINSETYQVK